MYRQGLGDCFLLSFPSASKDRRFFMMIDCGVILGTQDSEPKMRAVLEDIAATTGGRVDLLVATHEHWDHVSGFAQAKEAFERLEVAQLWLAWTEDPANKFAQELRAHRRRKVEALRQAVARLRAVGGERMALAGGSPMDRNAAERTVETAVRIEDVLGFFGAAGGLGTGDALEIARKHARTVRFRRPGEAPIRLPGVEGVRIYVLGPPENELIKRSDPTKTGREVYEMALGLSPADTAFLEAVQAADGPQDGAPCGPSWPFDHGLRIPEDEARGMPFFRDHYYASAGCNGNGCPGRDGDHGQSAWRRIDGDWLGAASPLALQLDSDTNNTSLALAIELGDRGRVLLFPGDAQVGNWLSWEALAWDHAGGPGRVTAADLLRRTVLYKVGHHASHNATLRAKGLELMESPELVAMIPVHHEMAVKKRWNMPFPALLERLREKASGRVLRIDEGLGDRPEDMPPAQWAAFEKRVEVREGWIEYTIPFDD
jgi:beta-lactamase superfamily II metal-dependent hydrolase